MYRLSGTKKRQRSKCYKGSRRERKTVTLREEGLWQVAQAVAQGMASGPHQAIKKLKEEGLPVYGERLGVWFGL